MLVGNTSVYQPMCFSDVLVNALKLPAKQDPNGSGGPVENYSMTCNIGYGNCLRYDPVFGYCHYGSMKDVIFERDPLTDDCSLFRRTFGINGISYEFNPSQGFWSTYSRKNSYNKMFYDEIFRDDIYDQQTSNVSLSREENLDFFIFPDSLERSRIFEKSPPLLAIHHPTTIPSNFIKLERCYR